jgi:hypothetical protein
MAINLCSAVHWKPPGNFVDSFPEYKSSARAHLSNTKHSTHSSMSTVLVPPYSTIATIHTTIQNTLKAELPPNLVINAIAPYLTSVNQWASQIPALLEGPGPSASANLVFAIRKDLFVAPQFTQSVMGPSMADLPAPFQEFLAFIRKLIDAQKPDKERSLPKVRNPFHHLIFLTEFCYPDPQTVWTTYQV